MKEYSKTIVPLHPTVPLDVPEDYANRVIQQIEGLLFLGINLPFARNLFKYIEERRVFFIIYSNFRKKDIRFESSERIFRIIPRDKMALDTLAAYFEDFLDWIEELLKKSCIAINFGDSPGEYAGKVMEDLLALNDFPLDFSLELNDLNDLNAIESMFKTLKLRKPRRVQGFEEKQKFVYFIQAGKEAKFKIGITNNIDGRLKQLQTGCPYPLNILAIIPGGRKEEKELHRKFKKYSEIGEWFSLNGDLKKFVDELRSLKNGGNEEK